MSLANRFTLGGIQDFTLLAPGKSQSQKVPRGQVLDYLVLHGILTANVTSDFIGVSETGPEGILSQVQLLRDGDSQWTFTGENLRSLQQYMFGRLPVRTLPGAADVAGSPYVCPFELWLPFEQPRGFRPKDTSMDTRGGRPKKLDLRISTSSLADSVFYDKGGTGAGSFTLDIEPEVIYSEPLPEDKDLRIAGQQRYGGEWVTMGPQSINAALGNLGNKVEIPQGLYSHLLVRVRNDMRNSANDGSDGLVTRIRLVGDVAKRGQVYEYGESKSSYMQNRYQNRLIDTRRTGDIMLEASKDGLLSECFDFRGSANASLLFDCVAPTGQAEIEVLGRRIVLPGDIAAARMLKG